MYWRLGGWTPVKNRNRAKRIVAQLGKQLAEAKGQQQPRLVFNPKATTEIGQCSLSSETPASSTISTQQGKNSPPEGFKCRQVRTVAYRRLPFSPNDQDWRLYRFTCPIDPDKSYKLAGYLPDAAFFAVRTPGEKSTPRWTLLDWTSTPLHRLKKMASLDLSSSDNRLDYLLFFVSYLGAGHDPDGLIHPYSYYRQLQRDF